MYDTETLAESIAAFVSILALIAVVMLACLAMMQPAYAGDAICPPATAWSVWIVGFVVIGGLALALLSAFAVFASAVFDRFGDDVSDHDNNMISAMHAEDIGRRK